MAAWQRRNGARRFTAYCASQFSSEISLTGSLQSLKPALLIKISTVPSSDLAWA